MPIYDNDSTIFYDVVRQSGLNAEAASLAFERVHSWLLERGHAAQSRYYIYRTGKRGLGADTPQAAAEAASARPRTVLAFANADTALGFAQRHNLRPTPRLLRMSLAQLLAVQVQRPLIMRLIFVDEPLTIATTTHLPTGMVLNRERLLHMLKGD